jgi:hypothetical protein
MMRARVIDAKLVRHYTDLFEHALAGQAATVDVSYVDGGRFWIEVDGIGAVYNLSFDARDGNVGKSDQDEARLMLEHMSKEGLPI